MMPTTMLIIAGVLALVATVLAFIYVVPEKKREKLGAFGKFLHDTCNFKYLMVEKILQALYIFTTAAVIIFGVLMLFRTEYNYWTGDRIWMGGYGLLIIILGPIAIRLSYELMMMAILLLKNVISINHKLADQTGNGSGDVFAAPNMQEMKEALRQRREAAQAAQTAAQAAQSQPANFCGQCGAKLENGVCPHCSAPKDSAPTDSTPPQEYIRQKKKHPPGCFFFCSAYDHIASALRCLRRHGHHPRLRVIALRQCGLHRGQCVRRRHIQPVEQLSHLLHGQTVRASHYH